MKIRIKPHGSYLELGTFITFSPHGSIFSSDRDTLEAVLSFELDNQAFINDMWLYLDDKNYIKSKLMDRWTAGFIYEGIVKRRLDPSVLTKTGDGKYNIKIFPMLGNSTRTVMINIYVPTYWTLDGISAKLPLDLLKVSFKKIPEVKVYVYDDNGFYSPRFPKNPEIEGTDFSHPGFGNVKRFVLNVDKLGYSPEIAFKHSFSKGIFANYQYEGYRNGRIENFYQLLIDPKYFLEFNIPRRVAIMIDYDVNKSNITRQKLLEDLRNAILNNLLPSDSFNIFISGPDVIRVSNRWLPADSSTVTTIINAINPNWINTETYLPNVLYEGVRWTNENSYDALLIILANSDKHGSLDSGNAVGARVLDLNYKRFKISTCSFMQYNYRNYVIHGQNWAGNNYLYNSLAAVTKGVFNKIPESGQNVYQLLVNTFNNIIGGFENLKVHQAFTNGFAYDMIDMNSLSSYTMNSKSMVQFGKFKGGLPATIEFSGYYRRYPIYQKLTVESDSLVNRYDNKSMWAGNYLRYMELNRQTKNIMMWDIVNTSVEYKVLSLFTAFLATEDMELDTLTHSESPDIPVELVYFDATPRQNGIDIYWATAQEINNMGFYIDRRVVGENSNWKTITFVPGKGNSKVPIDYNYFDSNVEPKNIYQYRIRQIDLDGTIEYFPKIVTVYYQTELNLTFECTPNPAIEKLDINLILPSRNRFRLEIFDMMGNRVAQFIDAVLDAGTYNIVWNRQNQNMAKVPAGIYFCNLEYGLNSFTKKIIIID